MNNTTRVLIVGVSLALSMAMGCWRDESAPTPSPTSSVDATAIPPGQIRMILEGLHSPQSERQYGALRALEGLPAVAQSQLPAITRLQAEGSSVKVRQKAAEILVMLRATDG